MKYIVNNSNDAPFNSALESYAFLELTDIDEIFILWINTPTIYIGKYQNAIEEINMEFVKENNIKVVRRLSGGGAVYHDLNNLNYTIISAKKDENSFDFKTFSKPIIETLAKLGIKAEFTGRNDIVIDGRKICGNAQAYAKGRMMHHGCLLFDVDLTVLEKALKVSKDKIESKGVKSVRSRVANIVDFLEKKIDIIKFKNLLLEYMIENNSDMQEYVLSDKDIEKINLIKKDKFDNWDWTYGKSPNYTIHRSNRYPAGKIEIYADVSESIIKNIKIYGDFFAFKDIEEVENILKNVKYDYNSIYTVLENININDYFSRMNIDEVTKAIVE